MSASTAWPKIILGWLVIVAFIYIYAFKQSYLIDSTFGFFVVLLVGAGCTYCASALETALVCYDKDTIEEYDNRVEKKFKEHAIERAKAVGQQDASKIDKLRKELRAMEGVSDILQEKDIIIPAMVIASNGLALLITASLALFYKVLDPSVGYPDITLSFEYLSQLSPGSNWVLTLPGKGQQTLTFFSSAILLIIVGKILPKHFGSRKKEKYVSKYRKVIRVTAIALSIFSTAIYGLAQLLMYLPSLFKRES